VFKKFESALEFTNVFLAYYYYIRPHSFIDKTPAETAGIKSTLHNYEDEVNQPYQITARIPIKEYNVRELDITKNYIKKPIKRSTLSKCKPLVNRANKIPKVEKNPNPTPIIKSIRLK
jgi:hypothetical protein